VRAESSALQCHRMLVTIAHQIILNGPGVASPGISGGVGSFVFVKVVSAIAYRLVEGLIVVLDADVLGRE
jgi:hypothetical protein